MSLIDFFAPVDLSKISPDAGFFSSQMGSRTYIYHKDFPELDNSLIDIAIFGVADDRNTIGNLGCADGPDRIRQKFYSLFEGAYLSKVVDLGNILAGETTVDTYAAVKLVVGELVKLNILPVILGGGQDITYAQYLAYEDLEQKADLVIIDSKFDLDDITDESGQPTSASYLNKIFLHEPNFLFNYSNIGYQTYFVSQDSLRFMEKLYFDVHRLGDFSQNIQRAEPIIRNASLLSFDISAVRSSDAPGNANTTPNGFYAEDACQLCRYAGMSDKLTSIGFYEYNPHYDPKGQTAILLAQMLWYFIDGFYQRKSDFPMLPKSQFLIYRTALKQDAYELIFVRSKKSDRWWLQVPYPSANSQNERFHLVPCTYEDYQTAIGGEMPDLWWRTYQKLG